MKLDASKIIAAAALGLAALATLSSPAVSGSGLTLRATQQAPGLVMQTKPVLRPVSYSFACAVAGTPVEFPDDITIWETGGWTVQAGTTIAWSVKAPNGQTVKSGQVTLAQPLAPGKSLFLSHVLPGGLPAGTPCQSSKA